MTDFANLFVEKYRPHTLDDIVLSKDDRIFFETLKSKQEIPHLLFAGIQGSGKTSLAKIIVNEILDCQYLYINASDENGIDTIRGKISGFARTKSLDGKLKVVLLDEGDQISLDAQKALRNIIEEFASNTRFIITCNYLFKIIPALQSRTQIFNLIPPIEGVVKRIKEVLQTENITIPESEKPKLLEHIRKNLPDIRRILNDVQKFSITGTLEIKNDNCTDFATSILNSIVAKKDLCSLRKEIIENEKLFSNDYRNLLKQLFEAVFVSNLSQETKTNCLMIIAKGMESDAFVVDKEINCFSTLISLSRSTFS
jgi:DNA polymerase III delta prime subunit